MVMQETEDNSNVVHGGRVHGSIRRILRVHRQNAIILGSTYSGQQTCIAVRLSSRSIDCQISSSSSKVKAHRHQISLHQRRFQQWKIRHQVHSHNRATRRHPHESPSIYKALSMCRRDIARRSRNSRSVKARFTNMYYKFICFFSFNGGMSECHAIRNCQSCLSYYFSYCI